MPSLSTKGQLVLPQEIRSRLGLKEGDRVEFVMEGDRTYIRPDRTVQNPFEKYKGALPYFETVEEINAWVDDLRSE